MRKSESFIIGCILGPVPVLFLLVAFISLFSFAKILTDQNGPYLALSALIGGIVIDVIFLKRWVRKAYQLSNKVLIAVYLFCSICALGFCMGVPILNFGVGMLGGVYIARKMFHINARETEYYQNIKTTALFSAVVMGIMCCLTGLMALFGGMIGSRFDTPLLSFTFTVPIILGMVLVGGLILCVLQYWLTSMVAKIATKMWQ